MLRDGSDLDPATIQENDRFVNDARVGGYQQRKGTLFECRDPECSKYIYTEKEIDEKLARCPEHGQMKKVEPEE
jgi:hypothetical protein